jgi:hypothetical protein
MSQVIAFKFEIENRKFETILKCKCSKSKTTTDQGTGINLVGFGPSVLGHLNLWHGSSEWFLDGCSSIAVDFMPYAGKVKVTPLHLREILQTYLWRIA